MNQSPLSASLPPTPPLPPLPPSPPPRLNSGQRWLMILIRFLVLALGGVVAMWLFVMAFKLFVPAPFRPDLGPLNAMTTLSAPQTVLVMGVDVNSPNAINPFEGARSDTMMLLRTLPANDTLSIINLPRDSKVFLNEDQTQVGKLNSAHAIGGPEQTVSVLKQTLGFPIERYLVIDLQGVRDVVDALGGVDVYIERRLHYNDFSAHLYINFNKGWHHLNGADAERYLRFRHDAYGDIGRIRRQQVFVDALKRRLSDPSVWVQLPHLVETAQRYIKTNLSWNELLALAQYAQHTPKANMRFATLPGHVPESSEAVSYWIIDVDEATTLLERLILGKEAPTPLPGEAGVDPPTSLPKIGIFYPPGHQAEADAVIASLSKAGFDVPCSREKAASMTQILDHTLFLSEPNIHTLQRASKALQEARVNFVPRSSSLLPITCGSEDVTIVIGKDAFPESQ